VKPSNKTKSAIVAAFGAPRLVIWQPASVQPSARCTLTLVATEGSSTYPSLL